MYPIIQLQREKYQQQIRKDKRNYILHKNRILYSGVNSQPKQLHHNFSAHIGPYFNQQLIEQWCNNPNSSSTSEIQMFFRNLTNVLSQYETQIPKNRELVDCFLQSRHLELALESLQQMKEYNSELLDYLLYLLFYMSCGTETTSKLIIQDTNMNLVLIYNQFRNQLSEDQFIMIIKIMSNLIINKGSLILEITQNQRTLQSMLDRMVYFIVDNADKEPLNYYLQFIVNILDGNQGYQNQSQGFQIDITFIHFKKIAMQTQNLNTMRLVLNLAQHLINRSNIYDLQNLVKFKIIDQLLRFFDITDQEIVLKSIDLFVSILSNQHYQQNGLINAAVEDAIIRSAENIHTKIISQNSYHDNDNQSVYIEPSLVQLYIVALQNKRLFVQYIKDNNQLQNRFVQRSTTTQNPQLQNNLIQYWIISTFRQDQQKIPNYINRYNVLHLVVINVVQLDEQQYYQTVVNVFQYLLNLEQYFQNHDDRQQFDELIKKDKPILKKLVRKYWESEQQELNQLANIFDDKLGQKYG